jgi:hypothetical protein
VSTSETATVHFTSSPNGGEIYVDGKFVGNTPSDITIAIGEHAIRVTTAGKSWSLASDVNLPAAVFAGSFAGMTAAAVAPLVTISIAGAGAGALYALVIAFEVFPGYGGRLGTVAFISTFCMMWIATVLFKR